MLLSALRVQWGTLTTLDSSMTFERQILESGEQSSDKSFEEDVLSYLPAGSFATTLETAV